MASSQTLKYYHENIDQFNSKPTYDCKELCRQLVLNDTYIKNTKTGYSQSELISFGQDWKTKVEVSNNEQTFGETFVYWSYTPPLGDHAAINFGRDKKGNDYFFSKNGTSGPLVIQSFNQLKNTYALWNQFRTVYKRGN